MKKILLALSAISSAMVLSACATSTGQPMRVLDGNKAAGTVAVGMYHKGLPLIDDGAGANWKDARAVATQACQRWGYKSAEPMSDLVKTKGSVNGYGQLVNGYIYITFQCVN